MFQSSIGAAQPAPQFNLPSFNQEAVRRILLGDYGAIIDTINRLAMALAQPAQKAFASPRASPCPPGATANTSAS